MILVKCKRDSNRDLKMNLLSAPRGRQCSEIHDAIKKNTAPSKKRKMWRGNMHNETRACACHSYVRASVCACRTIKIYIFITLQINFINFQLSINVQYNGAVDNNGPHRVVRVTYLNFYVFEPEALHHISSGTTDILHANKWQLVVYHGNIKMLLTVCVSTEWCNQSERV